MSLRVLITGGSGLLAVNWAAMRRHQDDIWLGLHHRQITMDNVQTISIIDGINVAIDAAKPDVVIHTAAMTDVDACEAEIRKAMSVNCDLAESFAKAAYDNGLRFVHISTDHLFNGQHPMMKETAPCSPLNNYGYSKWLGEAAVLNAHPEALILRVNFFGWGPTYRPSFSDWILSNLSNKSAITLFDNVYFTPLYIRQLVEAAYGLINRKAQGIYHLTSCDRISKYDFGIKLAHTFGLDQNLVTPGSYHYENSVPRPLDMSLSNTKTLKELGISHLKLDNAIDALEADKLMQINLSFIDQ
ncbi:SDR family oxidoreductase [Alphaproteobacteria bacterium]|nr:SDR family oxidoreductase [Alphaproteobacteria bacterium]